MLWCRVGVVLAQPLPAVEVVPGAGDGAEAGIETIGNDHQRVVVEQAWNRVLVVGVVVVERSLKSFVMTLEFDED